MVCPVCWTAYDETHRPRTLPCGHTLCTPCLNGLMEVCENGQVQVKCPKCRAKHPVPVTGEFPVNYALEDDSSVIEDVSRRLRVSEQAVEVLSAALETATAALETAGGGAARDASLPAAAASSIRDQALISPSLTVEDLRSLTQHARDLLQRGLLFAVHTSAGQSRQASLSLEDDRLYLHCLRDQPLPRGAVTLQVDEVVAAKPPCRVFLMLKWKDNDAPRRVLIHLSTDTPRARQFLLLCTGQRGPCYNGTKLFGVWLKRQPGEWVMGGDYEGNDGRGGAALLPDLDNVVYGESCMAGGVWGGLWCGVPAQGAQFCITTKDWPGRSVPCVFGKVVGGLEVVEEAARHHPITEVTVVDCGVVVD